MATTTQNSKQISSEPAQSKLDAAEYLPPHDLEAETAFLGSVILDNSVLTYDVNRLIKADYFYHTYHQILYEIIVKFYVDEHRAVDAVILKDELTKRGLLEKAGGIDYLTSLMESVPSAANADYYARIIREKYILRKIMLTCHQILRHTTRQDLNSDDLLNEAQRLIFEIARQKETEKSIKIQDILDDVFKKRIMESFDRKARLLGISTGLYELDDLVGGLQAGQLIIIAGRPGTGKSSLALKLLEQTGMTENKPVVIFTLEVTDEQVVQNLLCSHSRVNSHSLRKGFVDDEAKNRLLMAAGQFRDKLIFIDDSPRLSPQDLRFKARRLKVDYDIQLVIVDYLQLMHIERAESREREIAGISYALKILAKELEIPVVALAQLSREVERRESKHSVPRLSDLRESGAIEQDADVVLMLYQDNRTEESSPESANTCNILIAKQRNGPADMTVKVNFFKEYTRFENLESRYKEAEQ